MKNLKLILPMLAFVFAIALSFAFVGTNETVTQGYYEASPGDWQPVEVDCQPSEENICRIYFASDPSQTEYDVYAADHTTKLKTSAEEAFEISDTE